MCAPGSSRRRCEHCATLIFLTRPRRGSSLLSSFVRWQHRAAHLRNKDQGHWAAILVENVRARDKWTERVVAYLAGIGERDITKLARNVDFGKGTRQLDRLSNRISAEGRKRVERIRR